MPYIEKNNVYDQFDFSLWSCFKDGNFKVTATAIPDYICPSDPQGAELCSVTSVLPPNGSHPWEDSMRTNMAGVSDSEDWTCDGHFPKRLKTLGRLRYGGADVLAANGTMGERQGCSVQDVFDGTSHTLIIAEVTGGGLKSYRSHKWASLDLIDTLDGINGLNSLPGGSGPWVVDGSAVRSMRQVGPSSYHPGGCHFTIADGSVRFLFEEIDAAVMEALTTRAGGEVIPRNELRGG